MASLIDPIGWSIILMLAGCALVAIEVFIPSGGIIGTVSAACFIASILIAFNQSGVTGLAFATLAVAAVPTVLAIAFKYWPKTPMGKAFLGELPTDKEVRPEDPRRALIGRVGIARSKMLPSGSVEIDGQMVDAISQGQAVEPGTYVTVMEVRANRVVIRPAGKYERPDHANPKDILSRPIEELGIESLEDPMA
jgi:membrane-bound serine protease (ClpP class)